MPIHAQVPISALLFFLLSKKFCAVCCVLIQKNLRKKLRSSPSCHSEINSINILMYLLYFSPIALDRVAILIIYPP